jgi:hypothetical protein
MKHKLMAGLSALGLLVLNMAIASANGGVVWGN